MNNYLPLLWHLIILSTLILVNFVLLRKDGRSFLLLTILSLLFGSLVQIQGYFFYDEILLGFLVVSYILIRYLKNEWHRLIVIEESQRLYFWLIVIFSIFLVFNSIRGMMILNDYRMLRWIFFFMLIPALYVCYLDYFKHEKVSVSVIQDYLLKYSSLYFLAYIVIGVLGEFILGKHGRFTVQDYWVSGTSYALFVIIPAFSFFVLSALDRRHFSNKFLVFFAFMSFSSMFFDSRALQLLAFIGFLVALLGAYGEKKYFALYLMIYIILTPGYVMVEAVTDYSITLISRDALLSEKELSTSNKDVQLVGKGTMQSDSSILDLNAKFGSEAVPDNLRINTGDMVESYVKDIEIFIENNIIGSVLYLFNPVGSDISRFAQFKGAMRMLNESPVINQLFGYGFYVHRYVLPEYISEVYNENRGVISQFDRYSLKGSRSDLSDNINVFRTNGAIAYVVDTGVAGVVVMLAVILMAMRILLNKLNNLFGMLSYAGLLALALMWLTISNVLDIYLFYFILFSPFLVPLIMDYRNER